VPCGGAGGIGAGGSGRVWICDVAVLLPPLRLYPSVNVEGLE
jgi:hypothetical protein